MSKEYSRALTATHSILDHVGMEIQLLDYLMHNEPSFDVKSLLRQLGAISSVLTDSAKDIEQLIMSLQGVEGGDNE